jgi:DNA excision repair protein ERCC-2
MANKRYLSLSVHGLVDFLLREGDIDSRVYNFETMQMGTKLHASFQEEQGRDYLSEVPLEETFERPLGTIHLEGRADGIIEGGAFPVIDEIKSTVMPLADFYEEQKKWHLGQEECYALMYCHAKKKDKAGLRLTYLSQLDSKERLTKEEVFSLDQLEEDVYLLLDEYLAFYEGEFAHLEKRNASCEKLPFPYDKFRAGQREMARYCFSVAKKGGIFFCEAPTGIGKTMSALYPSLKAFASTKNEKIFYLTAKGTGSEAASDALTRLYQKGLVARDSALLSKEKICFTPGASCNPDECPFARGYYAKLREATKEALHSDKRFDSAYVKDLAEKYAMCPFELELDLSLFSDVIIGDYNYFFDPLVHLERYFDPEVESANYLLLVDEAHNLIERGRDMYSSVLSLNETSYAKKSLRKYNAPSLKRALTKLSAAFGEIGEAPGVKDYSDVPELFTKALDSLSRANLEYGKKKHPKVPEAFKDLAREAHRFSYLLTNYPAGHLVYSQVDDHDVTLHYYCLDASPDLATSLSAVKGAIFFSATLSPIEYYMDSIVGKHEDPYLLLPTPFPPENFELLIAPMVSVRYRDRSRTYEEVADYLYSFYRSKKGNYFLYFPSYEYLNNIRPFLLFDEGMEAKEQTKDMSEEAKADFLSHFVSKPTHTVVGLLINGGPFSEGIDLQGERLSGVAVVGMGIPQISHERDEIRRYYEKQNGSGYEYAYMNPGINKVMQAVGRLIRSETDVGAALLIDDRYLLEDYRKLYARVWGNYEVVTCPQEVEDDLSLFYKKKSK